MATMPAGLSGPQREHWWSSHQLSLSCLPEPANDNASRRKRLKCNHGPRRGAKRKVNENQYPLFSRRSWAECLRLGWGREVVCPATLCRHRIEHVELSCSLRAASAGPLPIRTVALMLDMSMRDAERVCQTALDKLYVALGREVDTERARKGERIKRPTLNEEGRQAFVEFCAQVNADTAVPFGHGVGRRLADEEIAAAYPGVRIARKP